MSGPTGQAEAALAVGDRVVVVEHHDGSRSPVDGGERHGGRIVAAEGWYLQVAYDDPAMNGGRPDPFWAGSRWRAWDGWFHWRVEPATGAAGQA